MYATLQGLSIAISYDNCFLYILEDIYHIVRISVVLLSPQAHIVSDNFSLFAFGIIDEA